MHHIGTSRGTRLKNSVQVAKKKGRYCNYHTWNRSMVIGYRYVLTVNRLVTVKLLICEDVNFTTKNPCHTHTPTHAHTHRQTEYFSDCCRNRQATHLTLCQGNKSSGSSFQVRFIYPICDCCQNINGKAYNLKKGNNHVK